MNGGRRIVEGGMKNPQSDTRNPKLGQGLQDKILWTYRQEGRWFEDNFLHGSFLPFV